MSIFGAFDALAKLAEDDTLGIAAAGIGKAAAKLPEQLDRIVELLEASNSRLVEISLGLDGLADPVGRPKFTARDVEAMMTGAWPPAPPELGEEITVSDGEST
jgi:hypothetical protein